MIINSVRAKFKVDHITPPTAPGGYPNIEMRPVYSEDPEAENKAFWDATPSGYIQMSCKPEAAAFFEEGKEYYIDFIPAE